jgi:hypothetical protein
MEENGSMLDRLEVLPDKRGGELIRGIVGDRIIIQLEVARTIIVPRRLHSGNIEIRIGFHTLGLESHPGILGVAARTIGVGYLGSEDTALTHIVGPLSVHLPVDSEKRIPLVTCKIIGTGDRRATDRRQITVLVALVESWIGEGSVVERPEGSRIAHATVEKLTVRNHIEEVDCLVANIRLHGTIWSDHTHLHLGGLTKTVEWLSGTAGIHRRPTE